MSLGCDVGLTKSRDSIFARIDLGGAKFSWPFFVRHTGGGRVELRLDYLKNSAAFSADAERRDALERITSIKAFQVRSTDNINGIPSFPVVVLRDHGVLNSFADFARWQSKKTSGHRLGLWPRCTSIAIAARRVP